MNSPRFPSSASFWILPLALGLLLPLQAQEIPPPSDTPPDRIIIPISQASRNMAKNGTGEATDDEVVAFAIAASAKGWIPEGSAGRLLNGMQVRVTVMVQGRIEHSTEPQRINYNGEIGLPLLQNVIVGEKDMGFVEEMLTEEYSEFYVDPIVNLEVVGNTDDPSMCPWGFITIMGNVGSPGPLAMPPTQFLTISGAVKRAGGLAASANKGSIRIFRPHPEDNTVEIIRVDLDNLAKRGRQTEDVSLRAGDVVYIPERIF
ncbi:MAG: polysaccharide biosynthesis/export family protein [Kiritimatiellia bacterium]